MFFFTTSMPTPRPETSVTTSAVEKPGAKIRPRPRRRSSLSGASMPRSRALASSFSRFRPLPSSRTSMTMLPPWWLATSVMVPCSGLPLASALGRHLDAVVAAVAHQVGQRVGDLLDQALVQLGGLAHVTSSTFLPSLPARSRSMRGKRLKTSDIGIMRIDITASCRSRVLRSRSARPEASCWCSAASSALAVLRQHGLGDDEFAHQVDQLVDLVHRHAQRADSAAAAALRRTGARAAAHRRGRRGRAAVRRVRRRGGGGCGRTAAAGARARCRRSRSQVLRASARRGAPGAPSWKP
jgi:hypothetical protein